MDIHRTPPQKQKSIISLYPYLPIDRLQIRTYLKLCERGQLFPIWRFCSLVLLFVPKKFMQIYVDSLLWKNSTNKPHKKEKKCVKKQFFPRERFSHEFTCQKLRLISFGKHRARTHFWVLTHWYPIIKFPHIYWSIDAKTLRFLFLFIFFVLEYFFGCTTTR